MAQGWDPSLLGAGLGCTLDTGRCAAEWGCGERCEVKLVGRRTGHMGVGAEAQGGWALARGWPPLAQAGTSYHPARCSDRWSWAGSAQMPWAPLTPRDEPGPSTCPQSTRVPASWSHSFLHLPLTGPTPASPLTQIPPFEAKNPSRAQHASRGCKVHGALSQRPQAPLWVLHLRLEAGSALQGTSRLL